MNTAVCVIKEAYRLRDCTLMLAHVIRQLMEVFTFSLRNTVLRVAAELHALRTNKLLEYNLHRDI